MIFIRTQLEGLFEIETSSQDDARGKFSRLFCEQVFSAIRPGLHFTQINLSETASKGTIRGMHFQTPPSAEAKLICCLHGHVFDVAVDVRTASPTFLQWHAVELDDKNNKMVFIPEGFAHGFQALSNDVQLLYMHTADWSKPHEHGLRHDDPRLAIQWPLRAAMVSEKDLGHDLLKPEFSGVQL